MTLSISETSKSASSKLPYNLDGLMNQWLSQSLQLSTCQLNLNIDSWMQLWQHDHRRLLVGQPHLAVSASSNDVGQPSYLGDLHYVYLQYTLSSTKALSKSSPPRKESPNSLCFNDSGGKLKNGNIKCPSSKIVNNHFRLIDTRIP